MNSEKVLKCENLSKCFSGKPALKGLNLEIGRGKIIGLLGPNGSGKTTLIKLINGLIQPTEGNAYIDGEKPGPYTKSIVSYLPDKTYFADWMRVKDIFDMFEDFYQDFDRTRAIDMCASLGIKEADRIKSMSKGTKEKVQLILVMSRRAQLYLLDEPIAGVDPAARDYILSTIINNYNEEGTIVISTHLISDIERVLDEFVFLRNGEAVMYGDVEETREKYGKSIDELFKDVFRMIPYEGYAKKYEEKGEQRDDIKTIEI